jgi:hypothetical protein
MKFPKFIDQFLYSGGELAIQQIVFMGFGANFLQYTFIAILLTIVR